MAIAAVTTSIPRIPYIGKMARRRAPRIGATTFSAPLIDWFRPATRGRCSLGTMSEVEAAIAGQWNPLPTERIAITT